MKRNFYIALILLLTACHIDPAKPVDARTKFEGNYNVEETSLTLNKVSRFKMKISKDPNSDSLVILDNFYDAGITVYAVVNGNKIFIPLQTYTPYLIEGFGSLNTTDLSFSYDIKGSAEGSKLYDECNASCLEY